MDTLLRPYQIDGRKFINTPSLGIAIFPDDGNSGEDLLKKADMAMYDAKKSGRNHLTLYSNTMCEQHLEKLDLERELSAAIEQNQLQVYYQAKVDTRSREIIGAEALLRWLHPEKGMVSPADFIPIAEESGLIDHIGKWVLQQACNQLSQWMSEDITPVPVAVNISAKQIASRELVSSVRQCLESAGIPANLIELELTESVLMQDTELAIETLQKIHEMGIQTSLDDFGTGYSSLSYLKQLCIHTLKIDRSFVRDIEHDADDAAITTAIVGLAKNLGIQVVAEGVENEHQLEFLKDQGCQIAQGFLFSQALPANEFLQLLQKSRSTTYSGTVAIPRFRHWNSPTPSNWDQTNNGIANEAGTIDYP